MVESNITSAIHDHNTEVIVAEFEGAIVGLVALHIIRSLRGHYGNINDLVVDLKFRGRGIGRHLMKSAHASAWIKGCSHIMLTSAEHREQARALYTELGYELKDTGVFFLPKPNQL